MSAVLIHALLTVLLLHGGTKGADGRGGRSNGRDDSLVVYPTLLTSPTHQEQSALTPTQASSIAANAQQNMHAARQTNAPSSPAPPKPVSTATSDLKPTTNSTTITQQPSIAFQAASSRAASASNGGSAGNDLLASYQAALRSAIYRKWQDLTRRSYPSGCMIHLSQNPGGAVTASSAASCGLTREDQQQLEAAALMAQPLPYTGYEPVFTREIDLAL